MLSRIKNRSGANRQDKPVEEDTKAFLLNRKIEVKTNLPVDKDYTVADFLGSGKFGDVSRCMEKTTGYELAAKIIPISSPEEKESVMNEVAIMSKLRHPRLIQLYDVYENKTNVTLIMELITGGELFERVIDDSFDLNEARCERFMKEILQGVDYIHSQKILHLDLKPENILCLTRTGFRIKIIDFGLARQVEENTELRVMFGTPEFIAPEVISYDPVSYASDMWSVGVICYVLLSGLSPFMGDNEGETLSNIVRCHFDFNYSEFDEISEDAKDLIKKLLVKDVKKRYTSSQCLAHPWFKEKTSLKRCATVSKKRLRHFVFRRKWQKAVNAIIALQRMGVVLTHDRDQKPQIRKYWQAQKTQKSFRKISVAFSPTDSSNSKPDSTTHSSTNSLHMTNANSTTNHSNKKIQDSISKKANVLDSKPLTSSSPSSVLKTLPPSSQAFGPKQPEDSRKINESRTIKPKSAEIIITTPTVEINTQKKPNSPKSSVAEPTSKSSPSPKTPVSDMPKSPPPTLKVEPVAKIKPSKLTDSKPESKNSSVSKKITSPTSISKIESAEKVNQQNKIELKPALKAISVIEKSKVITQLDKNASTKPNPMNLKSDPQNAVPAQNTAPVKEKPNALAVKNESKKKTNQPKLTSIVTNLPKASVPEKIQPASKAEASNRVENNAKPIGYSAFQGSLSPSRKIEESGTSAAMAMASLSKKPTGIANKIKLFSDPAEIQKATKPKKKFSLYS